ncbi:Uncharacterised protein [Klebsiella pneumoniae]|nr:Uncharacterised protein [Klebsiella pneumoniae]
MRTGSWKTEVPGAEVPDDRRQQHREHHGEAMCGTHVKQQIGRQHMHDGIGYAETAQQNAEEVEERRHRHSEL